MLGSDNYILSLNYLHSPCSSSSVINGTAGEFDESSERWMQSLCLCIYVCVYMLMISWCLCTHSNDECVLIKLSGGLNYEFAILSCRVLLCHSLKEKYSPNNFVFLIFLFVFACRNSLSVCEWEATRPSSSLGGSAVSLCCLHRRDKEPGRRCLWL